MAKKPLIPKESIDRAAELRTILKQLPEDVQEITKSWGFVDFRGPGRRVGGH